MVGPLLQPGPLLTSAPAGMLTLTRVREEEELLLDELLLPLAEALADAEAEEDGVPLNAQEWPPSQPHNLPNTAGPTPERGRRGRRRAWSARGGVGVRPTWKLLHKSAGEKCMATRHRAPGSATMVAMVCSYCPSPAAGVISKCSKCCWWLQSLPCFGWGCPLYKAPKWQAGSSDVPRTRPRHPNTPRCSASHLPALSVTL